MSDRRRRDPTLVEGGAPQAPGAPSFGSPGREPTIQDPYRPPSPSGGYPASGDIASPAPSWGGSAPAAPAWPGQAAPVVQPVARPRRQVTVDGDLTGGRSAAPAAHGGQSPQPGSAPSPGRRIAGWLLSSDRLVGHVLRSGSNLVGRDAQHDILIDDPQVSGLQCNIICEVEETLLMPRPEARNPSVINGKRVYNTETIPPFAKVQLGGQVFTYIPAPPAGEP